MAGALVMSGLVTLAVGQETSSSPDQILPYQSGFEPADGFHPGDLHGQGGWTVDRGSAEIALGGGEMGSAGLRINPSKPFGQVSLRFDGADTEDSIVFSDFLVKPVAVTDETAGQFVDAEGSIAGFFKVDRSGELHVLNGDGNNGGEWLPTGARFVTGIDGKKVTEWIRLTLRQDFQAKVWDLYVNGELSRANLGLWSDEAETLTRFSLMGHSHYPLGFDALTISRDNPAFPDADNDGLPDAWEARLGSLHDRDDDPDDDDLTNIEELALGTDPLLADSNGDGKPDGSESPASGEDSPEVAEGPNRGNRKENQDTPLSLVAKSRWQVDPETLNKLAGHVRWERRRRASFAFPPNPSDDDLMACFYLKAPFRKTAESSNSQRRAVAHAIEAYLKAGGMENTDALEHFTANHPGEPYTLWIDTCIALAQWEGGRYSAALKRLEEIVEKTPSGESADPLRDLAQAKLAACYSKLGRKESLAETLRDLRPRTLVANVDWDVSQAQMGLASMNNQPEVSFNCGTYALRSIRREVEGKATDAIEKKIENARSKQRGFSLREIEQLSREVGMNYRAVRRPATGRRDLLVPSVVHWKSRHFAAIVAKVGDGYLVSDPTFASRTFLSQRAIDEESSGYFLVPETAANTAKAPGWEAVAPADAEKVIGMGIPTLFHHTTGCDTSPCSRGLPSYGFNEHHGAYVISDTPIWVDSPLGFSIDFSVRHRSYHPGVHYLDGLNLGTNNWFVSWGDKITVHTGYVILETGDGRQALWSEGTSGGGAVHYIHQTKAATLQRTGNPGSYVFVYTKLDGTRMTFSHNAGPFLFLSEVVDSRGRKITVVPETHSGTSKRPREIKDDYGNGLRFIYVSSSGTGVFQIKEVRDLRNPSRKATFSYSTSGSGAYRNLDRITDAEGLWADFTYQPEYEFIRQNGGANYSDGTKASHIVKEMKTASPTSAGYVTAFHPIRADVWPSQDFVRFGAHITDPEGFEERILFGDYFESTHKIAGANFQTIVHGDPPKTYDDAHAKPAEVPDPYQAGAMQTNLLNMGCTFFWGKKAMHDHPPNDPSGANYERAVHTHWLRTSEWFRIAPIPASRRTSETHRVFFSYPDQWDPHYDGESSQPDAIARTVRNESGQLVTQVTKMEYYDQGDSGVTAAMHDKPKKLTDPSGRETQFSYFTDGRLWKVRQNHGGSLETLQTLSYFSSGPHAPWHLPATLTDAGGNVTNFAYNDKHQIKETWITVDGSTEKTVYVYDSNPLASGSGNDENHGYLKEVRRTDPDIANATYSSPTVLVSEITGYDAYYRPNKFKNADGAEVAQVYDKLDRVTSITHPDTTTETIGYTRGGKKYIDAQTHTDREGKTTDMLYNGNRQLVEVLDAANGSTRYGWCSCGDLEWLMDPKQSAANPGFSSNGIPLGGHTRWHRDALGRVTSKVYADGKSTAFTYQPASGLPKSVTFPNNSSATMTFHYYKDGNLQKIDYAASDTPDVTFWYDDSYNRVTKRQDGAGYHYYYYHAVNGSTDGAGQLRFINGPWSWDSIYYNYDDRGRVDHRYIGTPSSYPNIKHDVSWDFDSLGRLTQYSTTGLGDFDFAYIEHAGNKETGLLDHIDYPTGQQTRFAYAAIGQGRHLTQIINDRDTNPGNSNALSEHTYTHYPSGHLKTWHRNAPGLYNKTFSMTASGSYDPLYQLAKVNDSGTTYDFTYDATGNRTKRKVGSTTYDHGASNSRNQLTGYGMTYDDNGNLLTQTNPVTGSKYAYLWDSINRLREIRVDLNGNGSYGIGDTRSVFHYDGLSRRYKQQNYNASGGSWTLTDTIYYRWCGGEICQKRVGGSSYSNVKSNYYGNGETRHTTATNKSSYYFTHDHLGSIREVTSLYGNTLTLNTAYDYTPYGERVYAPGGSDAWKAEFGYTGHFFHQQSGTHLAWFRGYDPRIGRWLNADPIGEDGGVNVYAYCFGSPGILVDIDGLKPDALSNFTAGMGDTLTLGLTSSIRRGLINGISNLMGLEEAGTDDDGSDPCSGAYTAGRVAGTVLGFSSGAGGVARLALRGSTRQRLYEIGQKTLPNSEYTRLANKNIDPVKRGIDIVRENRNRFGKTLGDLKSGLPSLSGSPNFAKTAKTGLTPGAQALGNLRKTGIPLGAALHGAASGGYGLANLIFGDGCP